MLKRLWYYLLRQYIRVGLWFYCDKLRTTGSENIPKDGAVIFTSNHNNAFLDAILIIAKTNRITYSLTRSDVFKKKGYRSLLNSLHLLPIFRVRDGLRSVAQNHSTFQKTTDVLGRKNAVIVFPEAQHHNDRQLKPISKGFTRVAFEASKAYPDLPIYVVPVGINYQDFHAFPIRVQLNFGQPIDVHSYYNPDDIPTASKQLRDETEHRMQQLVTHISDQSNYHNILNHLNNFSTDFTNAKEANDRIKNWQQDDETLTLEVNRSSSWYLNILRFPLWLNNIIPCAIWKMAYRKIKDPVFIGSIKFGVGVLVFPVCYILQSALIVIFLGVPVAVLYLLFSLFSINTLKAISN